MIENHIWRDQRKDLLQTEVTIWKSETHEIEWQDNAPGVPPTLDASSRWMFFKHASAQSVGFYLKPETEFVVRKTHDTDTLR